MGCPPIRHFCDNKSHRQELPMCGELHPSGLVRCTRLLAPKDPLKPWYSGDPATPTDPTVPHDGSHAGYGFSTTSLVSW